MKNNKGITLVALVVTIIVLLVLASVSINVVFGQDGIINKAKIASSQTKIAQAVERISLLVDEAMMEAEKTGGDAWDIFIRLLYERFGNEPNVTITKIDDNTYIVTIDGKTIEIIRDEETGKIEVNGLEDGEEASNRKLVLSAYNVTVSYPEGGTIQVKKNETGGTITVESDNPNVIDVAYNSETNTITLTCGEELGEATITVKSQATEETEEQTVEIKVVVVKGENDLALSSYGPDQIKPSKTRNILVTKNPSEGAITVTSSNSNRATATYDATNKKIAVTTGTEEGEVTITVTTAETNNYKAKTVEYKVIVTQDAPLALVASNITSQNVQGSYYDPYYSYSPGGTGTRTCSTCSGRGTTSCSGSWSYKSSQTLPHSGMTCVATAKTYSCSSCGATGTVVTHSNCGAATTDTRSHNTSTCSTCSGTGKVSYSYSGSWSGRTLYSDFGTLTIDSTSNSDGTITLTANTPSGVTVTGYSWSGAGSGNTESITVSSPGTYNLSVSMSSGSYTGTGSVSATIIED